MRKYFEWTHILIFASVVVIVSPIYYYSFTKPEIDVRMEDPFDLYGGEDISGIKKRYKWDDPRIESNKNDYEYESNIYFERPKELKGIEGNIEIFISNYEESDLPPLQPRDSFTHVSYKIRTSREGSLMILNKCKKIAFDRFGRPDLKSNEVIPMSSEDTDSLVKKIVWERDHKERSSYASIRRYKLSNVSQYEYEVHVGLERY
jgi:hypothetical protein